MFRSQPGIDPLSISVQRLLGGRIQGIPGCLSGGVQAVGAHDDVLIQGRLAEYLTQRTLSEPALQLHLPKPVARMQIAHRKKNVAVAFCTDARHAVGIERNTHWRPQSGHVKRAGHIGHVGFEMEIQRRSDQCERKKNPQGKTSQQRKFFQDNIPLARAAPAEHSNLSKATVPARLHDGSGIPKSILIIGK